jgi:predicted enzyme related to lactoylglutathione lyase
MNARFVHTNLVARDWRKLADFYQQVFGCVPVPPERNLSGATFDALTGLDGAVLTGMHLRLPGFGEDGPTLEVFQYQPQLGGQAPAVNRPGFGHIAFAVDDVEAALEQVRAAGGGQIGEVVRLKVARKGRVHLVYALDPEGNIVELQAWENVGSSE